MNRRLAKLLAALLLAALLMTNVAFMEDAPVEDAPAEEIVTIEEPAGAAAEEPVEEEAEPAEDVEPEAVEAVDELVAEQDELELVETPAFEAQVEEELPVEEEQPVEDAPEIVEAEADEAAKLMAPDAGEIAIDAAHFPDAAFRSFVAGFDTDGNGKLSLAERTTDATQQFTLSNWTGTDPNNKNIKIYTPVVDAHSLQGIEYFPRLSNLFCDGLNLSTLDISAATSLASVSCTGCNLSSLVLGNNPNLSSLSCDNNHLTSLDISGCSNLVAVHCMINQIASLDITNCPKIAAGIVPTNFYSWNGYATYVDGNTNYLVFDVTMAIVGGGSPVEIVKINKTSSTYKTSAGTCFFVYLNNTEDFDEAIAKAKSSKGKVVSRVNTVYNGLGFIWTANAKGTSKITFKMGKKKYTVTVKVGAAATPAVVAPPPENAITVTKNMKYWVNVGTFHQIYLNGKTGKSFKSSNKKVAYVDQSGNIAAVGGGKSKITFKVGKKKRTLTLIVVDPTLPTAVYLDKAGTVAAKAGETQTITAAVPDGAITEYTWKSSNKKVATVANGVVTFKKKGKVTITCTTTRGKKKAKVTFKVSK